MDLRNATGLPMMKCKQALEAEGGDFEKAMDRLRKEGLKTADSKAGRATGEGVVRARIAKDGLSGAIVTVLCETEPVSKTPMFGEFVDRLLDQIEKTDPKDAAALLAQPWSQDRAQTVEQALKTLIAKIGENMKVDRVARFRVEGPGVVGAYVHHNGKVGALAAVGAAKPGADLVEITKELCMHIAYAKPIAGTREEIPADAVERERAIYRDQLAQDPKMKGKPAQVLEKIAEGKLDSFYKERVLPDQPWYKDATKSVTQVLQAAGGTLQRWMLTVVGS
jgi:elongation factor Ts